MGTSKQLLLLRILLVTFFLGSLSGLVHADPFIKKDDIRFKYAFQDIVARVPPVAVQISVEDQPVALGTIVASNGLILTKASQIKGDPMCNLRDGRQLAGRIVSVDDEYDLALIQVNATGLPTARFHNSSVAKAGQWVASLGHDPDQFDLPVAVGVIGAKTRKLSRRELEVTSRVLRGGFLGVRFDRNFTEGIRIEEVVENTAAERAKLQQGDLILSVENRNLTSAVELVDLLKKKRPGQTVLLKIQRGSETLTIKATLGLRPEGKSRSAYQNSLGSMLSDRRTGFPIILQHDSVLKPQQCGGPLIDLDGRVLGINIARAGRTESFTIPSEVVVKVLRQLRSATISSAVLPE